MKEKVYALAKGNFEYETPALILEPEQIDLTITAGETREERIRISNQRGTKVKGFGALEEPEIEFLPVFDAGKSELTLTVDASGWTAGTCLQGVIQFVTDSGEASLPYRITVTAKQLQDERGIVSDYLMLQERIREDMEAGAKLFHSEEFRELFLFRDQAGKLLYDHLTARDTRLQSMEEFLVAMGKKPPLHFEVSHPEGGAGKTAEHELGGEDIRGSVQIRVNTWGSTGIRVSSTADFIRPEMHNVWLGDLEKDTADLEYTIEADKVGEGIRVGSLVFESPYERKEIFIRVYNAEGEKARKVGRAKKAVLITLYRMYLACREGRVDREDFLKLLQNNRQVIQKLEHAYQTPVRGLMSAFLRDEQGMLIFYQDTERMPRPAADASQLEVDNYILIQYAKYLFTSREADKEGVLRLIQAYEDHGFHSLVLFYLKLCTDPSYEEMTVRLEDIREQIQNGVNSPLLYSELLQLYRQDPTWIRELDFVTVATVHYGLKEGLVTEDMAVVISLLAERSAHWEPLVFHMMTGIYEQFQSEDMLRAICSLLIRNERQGAKYFPWYERGVKAQLRITDLYEYYMYTLNRETAFTLPESVLTYFRYENHLGAAHKAFLYAYIIRKKREIPEHYQAYENAIWEFALEQLARHKISADLGLIYETMFVEGQIVDAVAEHLPKVMFTQLLICPHPKMDGVIVSHLETKEEEYYPLVAGNARIQIYTPNYQLYFVDGEGRYYTGTVEYRLEKLLHMDEYAGVCYENGARYTPLLVWLAVAAERGARLTGQQVALLHKVAEMDVLREYTKSRFFLCLYDYYKQEKDTAGMLAVLVQWDPAFIKRERIGEVASDCVFHGLYDKAEQMFLEYGIYGCREKALAMLLLERIREKGDTFVPVYVKWALYLYRQHYYEKGVMDYLLQYYMGETGVLAAIYHKCRELSGTSEMEDGCKERLLGQVLFTGTDPSAFEKLFLEYYENGANRVLVKAFLSWMAYEYVVGRMELSEAVFSKIEKEAYYEKEKVMILAALKYFSGMGTFDKKQRDFIELQLENCANDGLILAFMKKFAGRVTLPYEIEHSVLVQHYSGTKKGVFLFLRDEDGRVYESQTMRCVFDGIYTKELLLFAGEAKRAYVYEEESGKRFDEIGLKPAVSGREANGFCRMVNEMTEAKGAADPDRYRELRREYLERHQVAGKLFTMH